MTAIKRLTATAALLAMALTIHVVESQIPFPAPTPGFKLGLANIVTLYALYALGSGHAFMIFAARVALTSVFSGQATAFIFGASGGLLAFAVIYVMKITVVKSAVGVVWASGSVGAIFHNVGQLCAAVAVARTPGIFIYLPALIIAGALTGAFTGALAQYALRRLPRPC